MDRGVGTVAQYGCGVGHPVGGPVAAGGNCGRAVRRVTPRLSRHPAVRVRHACTGVAILTVGWPSDGVVAERAAPAPWIRATSVTINAIARTNTADSVGAGRVHRRRRGVGAHCPT